MSLPPPGCPGHRVAIVPGAGPAGMDVVSGIWPADCRTFHVVPRSGRGAVALGEGPVWAGNGEAGSNVVRKLLDEWPVARHALAALRDHAPELVLVGGAVRDLLWRPPLPPRDIDVMVDVRSMLELAHSNIPGMSVSRNRHGNVRLTTPSINIDVFSPQTFFWGFATVVDALAYFDLDANAVGVGLWDGSGLIDPLDGLSSIAAREVRINQDRWKRQSSGPEAAVLRVRLLDFLRRHPDVHCPNGSIALENLDAVFEEHPQVVERYLSCDPRTAHRELSLRLEKTP